MPKVTVALITYNRPQYLRKAIDAVLQQTYTDFEFLICDNGSDIETQNIIKSFTDERIKYLRNDINEREFYNAPFYNSSGEYLMITHDDDIMCSDLLRKEIEVLNKNETVVAVGCNMANIDEKDNVIIEKVFNLNSDLIYYQNQFLKYFLSSFHMPCPTALMRKSFFLRNNLKFDLSVGPGADTFLWHKVSEFPVELVLMEEVLYQYRVHTNQDSIVNKYTLYEQLFENLLNDTNDKHIFFNERKQLMIRMVYANFSALDKNVIDYKTYKAKIANILRQHNLDAYLTTKIKIYQLAPSLVKKLLALKSSAQALLNLNMKNNYNADKISMEGH